MKFGEIFVCRDELLQQKGHDIARASLLPPHDKVALTIQKYLACEGRYTVLYHYHFKLLIHLCDQQLINIPYFLYETLKQMASHVRRTKHPSSSVSHHGLIKLLALHSLEKHGCRWHEITIVDEEGSVMEVSAQRNGGAEEQGEIDSDECNTLGNQGEQNVADDSNAGDILDQEDPDEFSQNAGHACSSSPANPRNDEHENKSRKM